MLKGTTSETDMPKKVKKLLGPTVAMQKVETSTPVKKSRERLEKDVGDTLRKVCGVKTAEMAHALASQVAQLQVWTRSDPARRVQTLTRATCLLGEIGPKTGPEALLAVQMIGVHEAATTFLRRANVDGQTIDGTDRNVLRATRLMRLFTEQLDAMARLKGRTSQQKVTVEHVHVHDGGQAIVGAVNAIKPRPLKEHHPAEEAG